MSKFKIPAVVSGISQSVQQFGSAVKNFGKNGRYFHSSRKGEIQEYKNDLNSSSKEKKKEAIKKIIAAMTLGKNVSSLFPDVINCMQTTNIELKKLIYLYVINYAKVQPELAILAINTFRKDTSDPNPLIRALAVRTMGCIRLKQVIEYLLEPLRRACKDSDPYVRKTAAICVCKLYDTSPEAVEEQGFLAILREMLLDVNPMVVANAVAALSSISHGSGAQHLVFDGTTVSRLLNALSDCSEWGQVFILDAFSAYKPPDLQSALSVLDKVLPRLNHANPAVVLSSIRIVLMMIDLMVDELQIKALLKKLGPPLVTLLASENEVHYVALRNITLIVQKYPAILSNDYKMFYCKYDDPLYVKIEKLEILVRLASEHNITEILEEFKEYASEVDVDFVRKTVRAIGHCAMKIELASENCVTCLLSLIETKVNYVVQETVIVMRDIFRKYPDRYESVISLLFQELSVIDDPEAKSAMIWIIGEYCHRIQNADIILSEFAENFLDNPVSVRLQLLTAAVKLFLRRPSKSQALVTRVLKLCTEENTDPDLRDRGFIYWRLLSLDPEATREIVLGPKPTISLSAYDMNPDVLDQMLKNLSTLASVFHKLPESFISRPQLEDNTSMLDSGETESSDSESDTEEKERLSDKSCSFGSDESKLSESCSDKTIDRSIHQDLLALGEIESGEIDDPEDEQHSIMRDTCRKSGFDKPTHCSSQYIELLSPDTEGTSGKSGLSIRGCICKEGTEMMLLMSIINRSDSLLSASMWAVQINKNSFGFAPKSPANLDMPDLPPKESATVQVPLCLNINFSQAPPPFPLTLQIAVRTSLDIFYLKPVPYEVVHVLASAAGVTPQIYQNHWERMTEKKQMKFSGTVSLGLTIKQMIQSLEGSRFAKLDADLKRNPKIFSMAAVTSNKLLILLKFAFYEPESLLDTTLRADATQMFVIIKDFLVRKLGLVSLKAI